MTKTGKFVLFIVLATMLFLLARMQNDAAERKKAEEINASLHSH
jgi:hypothetical protein